MKTAWLCHCLDGEHATERRADALQAHFAYIESIMDRLLIAGPLKDENDRIIGSLLVYDTDSREQAAALLENDPYHQAGVWGEVRYEHMSMAAGQWIGGKAW